MKKPLILLLQILFAGFCFAQEDAVDWNKARELYQRSQRGETLTVEEKTYLDRAKAMRGERPGTEARGERPNRMGGAQREAPERLIPLSDITGEDRYEGEDGGLYGGGRNAPPEELRLAAEVQLKEIVPRNPKGEPSTDGRIVFISISMSNATQEFSTFVPLAKASPVKASEVVVVDCAQGGQAMAEWAPPDARPWEVAMERLAQAGVTPEQVQVAWVKLANKAPGGSLEEHGRILESDTLRVLQNAKEKFPNLRIAYLGSRIWAGNASGGLNPEPYAYESAFVVRWMIERQMEGDVELALDKVPLLVWGPYLWAEGERGRGTDDLVWLKGDFAGDGVHPSQSGRAKVAKLLLDFVMSDPLAKPWFTGE